MAKQIMGSLPDERTSQLSPFEATALDLFGPFQVKDVARGRRSFKCWIIAYVCLSIKAVHFVPCPGYDTATFMTSNRHFTGIFGQPRILCTDHSPSLVLAAETPDWTEIATAVSQSGTEWRQTAKGCSWRNGLAERVIHAARHTLAGELTRGQLLDFHEFGAVLSVVGAIMNARPLSVRNSPSGDFTAISPQRCPSG